MLHIQVDEFTHPYPGGIEQLQHGMVPISLGIGTLRLLQKQLDLFAGQNLRELSLDLGGSHSAGRIGVDISLPIQIPKKGLERSHRPSNGGYRLSAAH